MDLFEVAAAFGIITEPVSITPGEKSSSSADQYRVLGNKAFKLGIFTLAIRAYNESLTYSPVGSANIPLCYGNRSAVYCEAGMYALAIDNIELARKHGYPAEKMAQLDAREEKCIISIANFGPDENSMGKSFFKLSHPPNEKIPFIAGCLELHKNEKYGRLIITNKNLKTGDIIAIEKPVMAFATDKVSKHRCFFCAKSENLIPCSHCTEVMFCSEECQQKAAVIHINVLFPVKGFGAYRGYLTNILKIQFEAYRIAGGVDEALELLKDAEGKTIFDFDFSDPKDPDYEKNMLIALHGLHQKPRDHKGLKPELLAMLSDTTSKTPDEIKQFATYYRNQIRIYSSNLSLFKDTHDAIFLFRALLNHSCYKNICLGIIEDKMVWYACRPIKAGEQLFISYGTNAKSNTREERQMKLNQEYNFQCDCEACVNDWPQQFPRKDPNFVEPGDMHLGPEEAMKLFKKNCKYIDENAEKLPCYEVDKLIDHNTLPLHMIAGYRMF